VRSREVESGISQDWQVGVGGSQDEDAIVNHRRSLRLLITSTSFATSLDLMPPYRNLYPLLEYAKRIPEVPQKSLALSKRCERRGKSGGEKRGRCGEEKWGNEG